MNNGPLIYPILMKIKANPGSVKDSNRPNIVYKKTPKDTNKSFFLTFPVVCNALIKKPSPKKTIKDIRNIIIKKPAGDINTNL